MKLRLLSLTVLLLLSTLLAACAPVAAPATTANSAPLTEYANQAALVDTAWVQEHLADPKVRLLAISGKREDYDAGHLPNAIYVNLSEDMTNPEDSTRGQILTQEALSALMSRLGVANDDTVVVYDNSNNLLAARAYWALKYYQHADVRVYNGGTKKWAADGNALNTEAPAALPATTYVAGEADPAIRTTSEYVLSKLDDSSVVLCDARNAEEFAGTDVRSARGGHIPGAINVDWVQAVNGDTGVFRDAAALQELYEKAGFTKDKEIITYCQTGVRGAHTWFVLTQLLGYPNVRNYDGSWEEWGNDAAKPIE